MSTHTTSPMATERLDVWELAARGRDAATASGEAQSSSTDKESTVLVVGSAKAVSIPMLLLTGFVADRSIIHQPTQHSHATSLFVL